MRRLLLMVCLAMLVAGVTPAITVSPAFAAEAKCNPNEPLPPPRSWANLGGLQWSGTDKALAVEPPWGLNSDAYIWGLNGDIRQKWVMDCVGYDATNGLNYWRMRYAADISLCLQPWVSGQPVMLYTCGAFWADQLWQKLPVGGGDIALRNVGQHKCLYVGGYGFVDGDPVHLNACDIYDVRERWY